MAMDVLVTGGTGFVGREVVAALQDAGFRPVLLARSASMGRARAVARASGGEAREADIYDAASVEKAMSGCGAVIHLVGIISQAREVTFGRVHVEATRAVLAAAQLVGARRFVHMSALGTRPDALSEYHKTKWSAEECVRKSGLDFTIFRPSLIYGRHDRFVNMFAKMSAFSPVLPVMGNPNARFAPIDVQTVAKAFAHALRTPGAYGQTYDLCGPEKLTLRQILAEIASAANRRRLLIQVPQQVAKAQASFLEVAYGKILGLPPPLNRDQLLMLNEDNVGDAERAHRMFGLNPPPFREGIRSFVGECRNRRSEVHL